MAELARPTTSGGDDWTIARKHRATCFGLAAISSPMGQGQDNPKAPLAALGLLGSTKSPWQGF
jgi:hypothetical protein